MTEQESRRIKAALDDCLSGVDALPSVRPDILRAVKGEKKVKRNLSKGLVLALVLILMMSWKECEVPASLAADEVTFSIGVFTTGSAYYQTAEALYTAHESLVKTTWYDFTVKKTEVSAALSGTAQTADWTATADLTASAIDVKGEIIVKGPEGWTEIWTSWENPGKLDYINDWVLYIDGVKEEGHNLDGGVNAREDGTIRFTLCYKLDRMTADMRLVPKYRYAGEKLDEAIVLTAAK